MALSIPSCKTIDTCHYPECQTTKTKEQRQAKIKKSFQFCEETV